MARPKNEKLEIQRREEILQAAARVFRAKGFHLARTEDICTEAETSGVIAALSAIAEAA